MSQEYDTQLITYFNTPFTTPYIFVQNILESFKHNCKNTRFNYFENVDFKCSYDGKIKITISFNQQELDSHIELLEDVVLAYIEGYFNGKDSML